MPTWMQILIGTAGLVTALSVLFRKLRSGLQGVNALEEAIPVLREFTRVFSDDLDAFVTLRDIALQFRTDSGTTLRDVVNRLEANSKAQSDVLDKLTVTSEGAAATGLRIEEQQK